MLLLLTLLFQLLRRHFLTIDHIYIGISNLLCVSSMQEFLLCGIFLIELVLVFRIPCFLSFFSIDLFFMPYFLVLC